MQHESFELARQMQLAVNALLTMAMHLGSYGLSNASLSNEYEPASSLWLSGAFQRAQLCTTRGVVPMEDRREFAPEILFVVVWSAAILYFVLMSY
jgi:hypothetical protein